MEDDLLTDSLLLRLTPEQKEWLRAQGRELDRSMGSVVRRWIELQRRKEAK